jgi:integrase
VLVFYCLGLRVSELCGLTLEETDLTRGSTWILGKGRKEKELVPLPAVVVTAIRSYLTYRGRVPRPLFQTRGQPGKNRNGALETRSVLRIVLVRELGQKSACTSGVTACGTRALPRRPNSGSGPASGSTRFARIVGIALSPRCSSTSTNTTARERKRHWQI